VNVIKLYIDEDAMERLAYAAERGSVLYTFNVSDFYRLHTQWVSLVPWAVPP